MSKSPRDTPTALRRLAPTRFGLVWPVLAGLAVLPQAAWAQAGPNCETISADIQQEQPTALPTVSGQDQYTLGGRTSEQVIQQWATIQDGDAEACRLMKDVQHRLAGEAEFADRQCPDVLPELRHQTELARGEAKILCRGRE